MTTILQCDPFYPSFFADFLNSVICAVIGVLGAYLIYFLSIRRIRIDRLKYVVSLLESFIFSAKKQAEFCEDHSKKLLSKPFANWQLKLEANRDIKRLADKMDQEGVYHAYLWKFNRHQSSYEDFKNLYGYIDYLDYLMDDLITTNVRTIDFMWQRKKKYEISFKKLKELIQALSLDEEINLEHVEFVKYSIQILKAFLEKETENENLVDSFTSVVEPLRKFIVEKVKNHPKVTEIYLQLDDLAVQYYSIELQAKHNAADYKDFSKSLKEKAAELDNASKKLRDSVKQ